MNGIKHFVAAVLCVLLLMSTIAGCSGKDEEFMAETYGSQGDKWYFGFGKRQIVPDESSDEPLYIAGYNNALTITGVLDLCEARAVWVDTGSKGVLIIGIDCVALDHGTVTQIRDGLKDIPNCAAIHVYATHTHAGPDTLGLWGQIGVNGKNSAYMQRLIMAAQEAGREAAQSRQPGQLYYGKVKTEKMFRDSRDPQVYDENLYQLRFAGENGSGLRMFFYGAHAESLRGSNRLLSRDFPGLLCDGVTEATGDQTMFLSSAAGGLIMTKEFVGNIALNAQLNLQITGDKLIEYALSITPESECQLQPSLKQSRVEFTVPLDNPVFLLYKSLGILNHQAVKADGATGYGVTSELSVVMLGDVAVTMIPGEMFPELVQGGSYGDTNPGGVNPIPLQQIAAEMGVETLLTVGLCKDELGYIVPPSDFMVNPEKPYLERIKDQYGEDHYEETNSVGPQCAGKVAEAFRSALAALAE